jgi:hypothetical protein
MATDTNMLMGEIIENPEGQERDVELLLANFLKALIEEQKILEPPSKMREDA